MEKCGIIMKKEYSVAICYRIYPKVSKVPPIYFDDKYKLSELCLKSLVSSLGNVNYKIWVLLDNCPKEYSELFQKHVPAERLEMISLPGIGNAGTWGKQMEILSDQTFSENIYFAEDDYFYLPDTFYEMLELLETDKDVHFVSPYDHIDYYTLDIHDYSSKIKVTDKRHWRTVSTTCMTFLTQKKYLNQTKGAFKTYLRKNYDNSIWLSLTKKNAFNIALFTKYLFTNLPFAKIFIKLILFGSFRLLFRKKWNLVTPMPSIATHMDSQFLAPTKNWSAYFEGQS